MSDDQYSDLPLIQFSGKIHLINTDQELAAVAEQMLDAQEFGFDTETRPSFKKGEVYQVALLQLSTPDDAYLVRLNKVREYQVLKTIFENENVLKVGVAIRDDIKQLQKRFGFEARHFVELQDVAKKKGLENFGLKGMTEEVLQARLSKAAKITNWEAAELTDAQLKYAATDAWVGLTLFKKLMS